MKKSLFLILILIIIGVAIWSSNNTLPKEKETKNQIQTILEEAKSITGINFSEITNNEFSWLDKATTTAKTIKTKEIRANNLSTDDISNIEHFLTLQKFNTNELNSSTSTDPAFMAYAKENIACLIISSAGISKEAPAETPEENKAKETNNNLQTNDGEITIETKNVILSCGFIVKPKNTETGGEMNDKNATTTATTTDQIKTTDKTKEAESLGTPEEVPELE